MHIFQFFQDVLCRVTLIMAFFLIFFTQPGSIYSNETSTVSLRLLSDRTSIEKNSIVSFTLEFENHSAGPVRILLPTCYAGEEFRMERADGSEIEWKEGLANHTVKMGVYPGKTFELQPGEKKTATYRAFLDKDYRLIFEAPGEINTAGYGAGAGRENPADGVPAEFIGCGRLFSPGRPDRIRVSYFYSRRDEDRGWYVSPPEGEDGSLEHLWTGEIRSNTLEIELK